MSATGKGNTQATGKKAKHGSELVQRIRGAVLAAFDVCEKRGKLLSEILADELEKNPRQFMDMVSKYCPKELEHTGEIQHFVAEIPELSPSADEWLQTVSGSSSGDRDHSRRLDS